MRNKKYMAMIPLAVMLAACGVSENNKAKNVETTRGADSNVVTENTITESVKPVVTEIVIEKKEETDSIRVDDKGSLIVDDKSEDVTIEKTDDGTEIAVIKTEEGKEVKLVVETDDNGNKVVDTTKTITDNGTVVETEKTEEKPVITINPEGKVEVITEKTITVTVAPTVKAEDTKPIETTDTPTPIKKPENTVMVTDIPAPTETPIPVATPKPTEVYVTQTPTIKPVITSVITQKPTDISKPTDTPTPTDTPKPTNTSKPTDTPKPTNTSKPTNTPKPTDTPTPTVHSHNWKEITKEVYHAEEGHYKDCREWIWYTGAYYGGSVKKSAYELLKDNGMWDEKELIDMGALTIERKYDSWGDCYCYMSLNIHKLDETRWQIFKNYTRYSVVDKKELDEENIIGQIWIVDKPAYTETVVTGYKCTGCGATK